MLLKRPRFFYQWNFLILLAFAQVSIPSTAELLSHGFQNDDFDVENIIKGDAYHNRLYWDPTRHSTVSVFNISSTSPLRIVLIREDIGNCEMFFLRLKAILHSNPMIACVGDLSDTHLKQECKWVNDSDPLNINQGNIYGMPNDCGPWYLTIFAPECSNTTQLSVEVSEPYDPLVFRWFRVITNLALLPAICIALKRRYYAEAIIYTLTFTMSAIYHSCEAEFHCFKGYSRLHYSDYYVSDLSIIATIWTMTRIKPPMKHLIFLTVAILLQFAVTETFSGSYHFFINLILSGPALAYLCFQYVYRALKYRKIYPSARRWIFNLIPGYSLAAIGATIHLVHSDPDSYYYVHCIWHVSIMLSVAFLLPVPADEDPDEHWWLEKMNMYRDGYAPLA